MDNIELKQNSFRWIVSHSKVVISGLLAFFILCFVLVQWSGRSNKKNFKEFLVAENLFSKWRAHPLENKEAFEKLKSIINELPQLKPKFEPEIAKQLLLCEFDTSDSPADTSFAAMTLKRIEKEQPYYSQFGYTTILISHNAYLDALEQAEKLKKKLNGDSQFWENQSEEGSYGHFLYAFNLLRLALLQKAIGSVQGEFLAWNELEKRAGWHDTENMDVSAKEREAYSYLEQNFQEGSISLRDWIQYRKNVLTDNL